VADSENAGIASIGSFKSGDSDPVHGDFRTAYPDAPEIAGYFYFVGGNHYDCTEGKARDLYGQARSDFIKSYSAIANP
jgi:hypothetical protein